MTKKQRSQLEAVARSTSLRHGAVRQAKGLLLAADGVANEEIGHRVGVSSNTVRSWRYRFSEFGVDDVGVIAPGRVASPGCPRAPSPRWSG